LWGAIYILSIAEHGLRSNCDHYFLADKLVSVDAVIQQSLYSCLLFNYLMIMENGAIRRENHG
jgi:hypothetical protein